MEVEFIAASNAAKLALYIHSILDELNIPQTHATPIYKDNKGALLLAQAGCPTKQFRHIDIQHYTIQDWVEHDLIELSEIKMALNAVDVLTKATPKLIFTRHCDVLFGYIPLEHLLAGDSAIVSLCSQSALLLSTGGAGQTLWVMSPVVPSVVHIHYFSL